MESLIRSLKHKSRLQFDLKDFFNMPFINALTALRCVFEVLNDIEVDTVK